MKVRFVFAVFLLCLFLTSVALGQPSVINYQGKLTDTQNQPLNETVSVQFSIYAQASGGTALWTETQQVTAQDGVFNVLLGQVNPLTSAIFDGSDRWLGLKVGGDDEMSPRQQIGSVGYALFSRGGGSCWDCSGTSTYSDPNYYVGIGKQNPAYKLDVYGHIHADGAIGAGNSVWLGMPVSDAISSTNGEIYIGREPGTFSDIKVGIGTQTPQANLEINSTHHEPMIINSSSSMSGISFSRSGTFLGIYGYGDICGGGHDDALTI